MSQAEQDRRIDYVEFEATDLDATKRFYSAVFGWAFIDYGRDYTSFGDGRLAGGFTKVKKAPRKGGSLVVIYALDLEAMLASVKNAGGKIKKEIFSFPGGRRFHFKDPNGNELAVWSDQ
jgi:predicted enzyme related to lactoylglutathione lyase